jgi:DNA-binding beta-propeller fold protein YncE
LGSAALLFAAGCERPRPTGYPGTALVGVGGEHAVALVDLNTFRPAGRLDLRGEPSAVAADSDRGYVLTGSNGTVHFIDCTHKMRAGSWQLSGNLNLLRLTPQRGQIVVSSAGDQELVIADAVHRKVTRRVKLASAPVDADVRLEPNSKKLYAALSGGRSGTLELVDIESGSHRKREIGGELGSIRFRNDGQLLFAGRYNDNTLVVLDTRTLETVCELPLPIRPENFSFSADQGQLFISGSGMDGVSIVFAYDTIEVEQTVLAGYQPGAMVCSKRPNYLFVASRAGSELTILNVDSRKVVALTQVGDKPTRIAITEDQQYALVLNEGSGDLAVIRIPAIGNMRSKSGAGSLPSGILTLRGISLFAMIPIGQKPTDLAIFTERA